MGSLLHSSGSSSYEYHQVVLSSRTLRALFRTDRHRGLFIELVRRAQRRTGIRILAYALLDTEVHFIVQTIENTSARSRFVLRVKSQYARAIHKTLGASSTTAHRRKHLFERRYRADELAVSEVPEVIGWLHRLPVIRGLTKDQNKYEWSSRQAYLRQVKVSWLLVDWALELDQLPDFPLPLPLSAADTKQLVDWLTQAVMARVGLPPAELHSRKRRRKLTLVRGVVAYHAMRWGASLRAIANALKTKTTSTLAPSTLTAAIDRYESSYPQLFDIETHILLADVLARLRPRALVNSSADKLVKKTSSGQV